MLVAGQTLPKSAYFILPGSDTLHWNAQNAPTPFYIKASDSFRAKMGQVLSGNQDYLVFIDAQHKQIFNQYRSYFSQPKLVLPNPNTQARNHKVFILQSGSSFNHFDIAASLQIKKVSLNNVVGVIPGKRTNEMVLFSAHYDHLGTSSRSIDDTIYNGANDDASGVTAIIELARYFKSKRQPERTLVFAAFTAEEVGGFGSKYFSNQLNPDEIVAMLNIEMIGKESKEGVNSAWMTGWDKSNLGSILQANLQQIDFKFFADPYPDQQLFYRSDNATLARLGVPAHSISTTQIDIDKDYHQISDEVSTLDITNITNTIKAIAVGSQGIVDGRQTPTRVNPAEVD